MPKSAKKIRFQQIYLHYSFFLVNFASEMEKDMKSTVVPRWEQKLDSYTKALTRLAHVVNESKQRELNEFELDSIVQRYEFTHETAWKLMKS